MLLNFAAKTGGDRAPILAGRGGSATARARAGRAPGAPAVAVRAHAHRCASCSTRSSASSTGILRPRRSSAIGAKRSWGRTATYCWSPPSRESAQEIDRRLASGDMIAMPPTRTSPRTVAPSSANWHNTPVRDANGEVSAIMAMAQDVTERTQNEEKLGRSESLLAEAQHLAHIGSWNWDIASDIANLVGRTLPHLRLEAARDGDDIRALPEPRPPRRPGHCPEHGRPGVPRPSTLRMLLCGYCIGTEQCGSCSLEDK